MAVCPFSTRRVGGLPRADVGSTGRSTGPGAALGMPLVSSLAGMLRYFKFKISCLSLFMILQIMCHIEVFESEIG